MVDLYRIVDRVDITNEEAMCSFAKYLEKTQGYSTKRVEFGNPYLEVRVKNGKSIVFERNGNIFTDDKSLRVVIKNFNAENTNFKIRTMRVEKFSEDSGIVRFDTIGSLVKELENRND